MSDMPFHPAGLPYSVRVSAKARRVILRFCPLKGFEVIIPRGFPASRVPDIVERKRDWIQRTQARLEAEGFFYDAAEAFPDAVHLKAVDRRYGIVYERGDGNGRPTLREIGADRLVLSGNVGDRAACVRLLQAWLQHQGRVFLVPWLQSLSRETGLRFQRVQVRRQRSRWGSCSSAKTISLNCNLLFLAPDLASYVLVHELAHTRHLNHSRAFWNLLARFEPNHPEKEAALKGFERKIPRWTIETAD